MMHTRCPACYTVFRVTPEQLRLKAGKVRCGSCKGIFNAFDGLLQEEDIANTPPTKPNIKSEEHTTITKYHEALKTPEKTTPEPVKPLEQPIVPPLKKDSQKIEKNAFPEHFIEEHITVAPLQEPLSETPEESTQAAREAGLVAARGLSDSPGYSRWAEEALIGDDDSAFESEPVHRTRWPFILSAALLTFALAVQLLIFYKTEVTLHLPSTKSIYNAVGIKIPLPKHPDKLAIAGSDFRADKANGFIIVDIVLRNHAQYAQAWPAIELTLKDAENTAFLRRVLDPIEYLPPNISPERFPAEGEVAIRLWIDAKDIEAFGYGLYIFYP